MCITSRCLPNQHFTYIINLTIIFLQIHTKNLSEFFYNQISYLRTYFKYNLKSKRITCNIDHIHKK